MRIKKLFLAIGFLCGFLIGPSKAALPDKDNGKDFKPMLHYGVGSKGQWRLYIRDPELRSAIGRKIIPANEWCSLVDQPYSERLKIGLTQFARIIKSNFFIEGSPIQKKVWEELKKIKFGDTKTYGEIAKKYKLSPRHVGKICSQNKIVLAIPCHRVIKSNGSIGGFSSLGGIILKKKLLDFEKN